MSLVPAEEGDLFGDVERVDVHSDYVGEVPREMRNIITSAAVFSDMDSYTRAKTRGAMPQTVRSGVIPYFIDNGAEYWLMARSVFTNQLTDFGGGCTKDEDQRPAACMQREASEEASAEFFKRIQRALDARLDNPTLYRTYTYRRGRKWVAEVLQAKVMYHEVQRGRKVGYSWCLMLPIELDLVNFMKERVQFSRALYNRTKGVGEVLDIDVVPADGVFDMEELDVDEVFDETVRAFVKLLKSEPLEPSFR